MGCLSPRAFGHNTDKCRVPLVCLLSVLKVPFLADMCGCLHTLFLVLVLARTSCARRSDCDGSGPLLGARVRVDCFLRLCGLSCVSLYLLFAACGLVVTRRCVYVQHWRDYLAARTFDTIFCLVVCSLIFLYLALRCACRLSLCSSDG